MNEREQQKIHRMTTAPIRGLVLKLAVPSIITMMVTGLYNMADTFFVGQIGTQATAAVGLIFPIMVVMQAIGFFFGMGSGNYISRALGAKDHDHAQIMASTGVICAFICGLFLLALGFLFKKPLLFALGARPDLVDPATVQYAADYLSLILLGAPFITTSFVFNNQMRLQGNALYSMLALVAGSVLNCVLDPLFIFVFQMEVRGAALATAISQTTGCFLLYFSSLRSDSLKIHPKEFCPNAYYLKNIAVGGIPSLFRHSLSSLSSLCLNTAAGIAVASELADCSIAAFSVVSKLMFFALSAVLGFGQGFQPVCGFNYGAKEYARVREGYLFCLRFGITIISIICVLGFLFAEPLIALFRDDPQVIAIGKTALRCQCCTLPLMVLLIITNMAYQNMGKAFRASLLALSRQGLTFIPIVLLLPRLFSTPLIGVYLSQPVADILALLISLPLSFSLNKELVRLEAKKNMQRPA